jgi:hypothetical protein
MYMAEGVMHFSDIRRLALAAPLLVLTAGCEMAVGPLAGRASDTWTHTYPLAVGGEVRVVNTNGKVEVESVEGGTVEIRAERSERPVAARHH